MDRVIKFRGKSAFDNQWYYGGYHKGKRGDTCIVDSGACFIIVNPESVGQFTGFLDIDDKEIYEGDIIQNDESPGTIEYVEMLDGCWSAVDEVDYKNLDWALRHGHFKVIGNVHDNRATCLSELRCEYD